MPTALERKETQIGLVTLSESSFLFPCLQEVVADTCGALVPVLAASVLWAIASPVCLMLPVLWPLSDSQAQDLRCRLSPLGLSLELSVPLTLAEDTMALPAHRVLLEAHSTWQHPHTRPPSSTLHLAKSPLQGSWKSLDVFQTTWESSVRRLHVPSISL